MAIVNNSSDLVINTYASKEIFDTLKAQGRINDNELHLIEGDDISFDDKPTEGSDNLVSSGVVFESVEQAKEDMASEALSNIEIEEILSKFI